MKYRMYVDGDLFYSTSEDVSKVFNANGTLDMGKAGSLTFTIPQNNPFYENFQQKKSIVTLYLDEELLFRGRVSEIDKDFYNQKTINCEGDLTFLIDTHTPKGTLSGTLEELFRLYVDHHNAQVSREKQFEVGIIDIPGASYISETIEDASYRITADAIEDMVEGYGGYLSTRYLNGKVYIDWIAGYNSNSDQTIQFAENLVSLTQKESCDDIFTVLIPVGDEDLTIESVNGGSDYLVIQDSFEKYGYIARIENFQGVSDPALLKENGEKFIKAFYNEDPVTINAQAVDLSFLGVDCSRIKIGQNVRIVSSPHKLDKYYPCSGITYDILNPGNTRYVFGVEPQTMSKRYAENKKEVNRDISGTNESLNRAHGGIAANADGIKRTANKLDKYITVTDNTLTLMNDNIQLNAKQIELRATNERVDGIHKRLSQAEIDINGDESTIGLKAQVTKTISILNDTVERLSKAEIDINGDAGTIGLKTQVTENTEWLAGLDSSYADIEKRVSSAEIDINGGEGTIGLKTKVSTMDSEFGERISQAEINIDGANSAIELKADKIDLNGYVTMKKFEADIADVRITESSYVTTAGLNTQSLGAHYVDTATLKVGTNNASWKSMTVVTDAWAVTEDSGWIHILLANHSPTKIKYIKSVSVDYSSDTIHYLGY